MFQISLRSRSLPFLVLVVFSTMQIAADSSQDEAPELNYGDFNGDGAIDLLTQSVYGPQATAFRPAGIRLFAGLSDAVGPDHAIPAGFLGVDWNAEAFSITVADFNGDGRDDLLLQNRGRGDHLVVTSDEQGRPGIVANRIPGHWLAPRSGSRILAGNFDGDGRADLLALPERPGVEAVLLLNPIRPGIAPAQTWPDDYLGIDWTSVSLRIGNVNGQDADGRFRDDLLLLDMAGDPRMLLAADTGNRFSRLQSIETALQPDLAQVATAPDRRQAGSAPAAQPDRHVGQQAEPVAGFEARHESAETIVTPSAHPTARASLHAISQSARRRPVSHQDVTAVGATEGEFTARAGAARYRVPVMMPPGRGLVTTDLAFTYDSGAGNGHLGVGWVLAGVPAVHRCPPIVAIDGVAGAIRFNADDRYCLDGERLVLEDGSGPYGAHGSRYRTEVDTLTRFTAYQDDNGRVNRLVATGVDGSVSVFGAASAIEAAGRGDVLVWPLVELSDPSGNTTRFEYFEDNATGEYYLTTVSYSHPGASRAVELNYEQRADVQVSFVSGSQRSITRRLRELRVRVAIGSPASRLARRYRLAYDYSPATGRSRLQSIQECANGDGDATESCLAPTVFGWEGDLGFDARSDYPGLQDSPDSPGHETPATDLDGDGYPDFFRSGGATLTLWRGAETGFTAPEYLALGEIVDPDVQISANPLIDWNADGRTDYTLPFGALGPAPAAPQFTELPAYVPDGRLEISWNRPGASAACFELERRPAGSANDAWSLQRTTAATTEVFLDHPWGDWDFRVRAFSDSGIPGPYSESGSVTVGGFASRPAAADGAAAGCSLSGGSTELTLGVLWIDAAGSVHTHDTGIPVDAATIHQAGDPRSGGSGNYYVLDINGDGLQDVLTRRQGTWRPHLRNSPAMGSGFTALPAPWLSADGVLGAEVIEYDGDGRADLAVQLEGGNVQVLLGRDTGLEIAASAPPAAPSGGFMWLTPDTDDDIPRREPPVAPLWADFNGDGLSDALLAQDDNPPGQESGDRNMYLYLNSGDGFQVTDTGFQSPFSSRWAERLAYFMFAIDYDADGDLDVMIPAERIREGAGPFSETCDAPDLPQCDFDLISVHDVYRWDVMRLNGSRFDPPTRTDLELPLASVRSIDLDADGAPDLFGPKPRQTENQSEPELQSGVWLHRGSQSDLMVAISDGMGHRTELAYMPGTRSAVYQRLPAEIAVFPDLQVTTPQVVLSAVSQSNGVNGELNQLAYRYRNARRNLHGRGNQGFEAISVIDHARAVETTSEFHTAFPLTGRPVRVTARAAPGIAAGATAPPHAFSETTWVVQPSPGAAAASVVYAALKTRTASEPLGGDGDTVSENSERIEVDDHGCEVFRVTTVVDAWVSQTDSVTHRVEHDVGPSGDPADWWPCRIIHTTVDATVTHRQTPFPAGPDWESGPDGASNRSSVSTDFHYDSSRNIVETVTPARDSGGAEAAEMRRSTVSTFDRFGHLVRRRLSAPDAVDYPLNARESTIDYLNSRDVHASSRTNPKGQTEFLIYDDVTGQIAERMDANGVATRYLFDDFGRLSATELPGLPAVQTTYAECANCINSAVYSVTSRQSGRPESRIEYDLLQRPVRRSVRGFDGRWIHADTHYNPLGQVERISEPYFDNEFPYETVYLYDHSDPLHRLDKAFAPFGQLTDYEYDGLTTWVTISTGPDVQRRTRQVRNSLGATVETEDALGAVVHSRNDALGNPVLILDASDNATTARYDLRGRKLSSTDANRGTWHYRYDAFDQLRRRTDAADHRTEWEYDVLGRQTHRYEMPAGDALTLVGRWVYDGPDGGDPLSQDSYTGRVPYIGRLHSLDSGEAQQFYARTFGYDSQTGAVTDTETRLNPGDGQHRFLFRHDYDTLGRPDVLTWPTGFAVRNDYNSYGYLARQTEASGSARVLRNLTRKSARDQVESAELGWRGDLFTERRYRGASGLTASVCAGPAPACLAETAELQGISYVYDGFLNLSYRENHVAAVREVFDEYDELRRLLRNHLETADGRSVAEPVHYSYDVLGNLTYKSDFADLYEYQGASAPWTGFAGPNAVTRTLSADGATTYAYDPNGNLTEIRGLQHRDITYTLEQKPAEIRNRTADGQEIVATLHYAPDQKLWFRSQRGSAGRSQTLSVDGLYEMVIGEGDDGTQIIDHKHYVDDFMVYVETDAITDVDGDGISDGTDNCRYAANEGQTDSDDDGFGNACDADFDDNGVVDFADLGYLKANMFGAVSETDLTGDGATNFEDVARLKLLFLAQPGPAGLAADAAYFIVTDSLGSADVVIRDDAAAGVATERFGFDAWGQARSGDWRTAPHLTDHHFRTGRSAVTDRGFTGHLQLDALGVIHMGGRVYDPALGRFLSVDPFVQFPSGSQSINAYSYLRNNPLSGTDPTGFLGFTCLQNNNTSTRTFGFDSAQIDANGPVGAPSGGVGLTPNAGLDQVSASEATAAVNRRYGNDPGHIPAPRITPEVLRQDSVYARLSACGYDPRCSGAGVFVRLTAERIAAVGLRAEGFEDPETGFRSALFHRGESGEYVQVFAGTNGINDIDDNVAQASALEAHQYRQAVRLSSRVSDAVGENLVFSGHSLGGGLASLAALTNGRPAVTFNAAGLSKGTRRRYGVLGVAAGDLIRAYYLRGDPLTVLQDRTPLPNAAGLRLPLPAPGRRGVRVRYHGISQVCAAMGTTC